MSFCGVTVTANKLANLPISYCMGFCSRNYCMIFSCVAHFGFRKQKG